MVQHAALLDSSSAGLWSAVHNERPDMAARSSAMNFFLAGCSWAVPVGNVLLKFLQPLGTCCRMQGQRTCASTFRWDFCHSNPRSPFGPITTHTSSAVCTCVTVPLDPHLWTELTNSTRVLPAAFDGLQIFVRARSRGRSVRTACFCVLHAPPV